MRSDGERRVRVLAADDSVVMREVMRTIFAMHEENGDVLLPPMELCGVARDGIEALEQVQALRPDVLLLDLEMPRLNGIGVLAALKTAAPLLPVILCSTHTQRGARATLDALTHGAKDYVAKPEHQRNYRTALESLTRQLLPKIAALVNHSHGVATHGQGAAAARTCDGCARVDVVVIGVSTGGPAALETMLPRLPRDFSVPVLVAQHMPRLFTGALAERLNQLCRMPVQEARDGVAIEPGRIWLAPGDSNMEIAAGVARGSRVEVVKLRDGGPSNACRPSVDVLFDSAAKVYGAGTLAVVMTGMGSDGTAGARKVRAAGGAVLAQDEASSTVWGMPARVADEGLASAVLPLWMLAGAISQRVQAGRTQAGRTQAGRTIAEARREVLHGVL